MECVSFVWKTRGVYKIWVGRSCGKYKAYTEEQNRDRSQGEEMNISVLQQQNVYVDGYAAYL